MWTVISVCLHSRLRLFMSLLLSFIHLSSFLFPFSPRSHLLSFRRNFVLWLILLAISGCAWYIFFLFFKRMSFLFFDIFFFFHIRTGNQGNKDFWSLRKSDFLIKLYSFLLLLLLFSSPYLFSHSSYNTIKFESVFFFSN